MDALPITETTDLPFKVRVLDSKQCEAQPW